MTSTRGEYYRYASTAPSPPWPDLERSARPSPIADASPVDEPRLLVIDLPPRAWAELDKDAAAGGREAEDLAPGVLLGYAALGRRQRELGNGHGSLAATSLADVLDDQDDDDQEGDDA